MTGRFAGRVSSGRNGPQFQHASSPSHRLQCLAFATEEGAKRTSQQLSSAKSQGANKIARYVGTDIGSPAEQKRSQRSANNILPSHRLKTQEPYSSVGRKARLAVDRIQLVNHAILMIFASGMTLGSICMVSGVALVPSWVPAAAGAVLGGKFALLGRRMYVKHWRLPLAPLRVVITGSTKGIGKAMAREFLRRGDYVMVTSRAWSNVRCAIEELMREIGGPSRLVGGECDVRDPKSVRRLAAEAKKKLGHVDVWINNAGCSGSFQEFTKMTNEQMEGVVNTNLLGSVLCTKAAQKLMQSQLEGGHIFNMAGAGSDGACTPKYGAYGATKAGIEHLSRSLNKEPSTASQRVKVHTLSPGMVLTALLLDGATVQNKFFFNILCVLPETSAAFLVPRIRCAAASPLSGRQINFLTPWRAIFFLMTAPSRLSRFFTRQGKAIYPSERSRFSDEKQVGRWLKETRTLAVQDGWLAITYSLAMTAAYLLCCTSGHTILH